MQKQIDLSKMPLAERGLVEFDRTPNHIKRRYRTIALVSVPRHLEMLDLATDDILIVTHSWLMWQELVSQGRHCMHYECNAFAREPASIARNTFIAINDWLFADGKDITAFRGVSLARMFTKEMQVLILEHKRLSLVVNELIERFCPQEIVYYDFRAEHSVLDVFARKALVEDVATTHGVSLIDQSDSPAGDDPDLPFAEFYGRHERPETDQPSSVKRLAVKSFSIAFGALGRIGRILVGTRPAVLLATTHLTSVPLIESFEKRGTLALILSDWYPHKRNLSRLLTNFKKGILPVTLGKTPLSAAETEEVTVIVKQLKKIWSGENDPLLRECHRYFFEHVVETGRFFDMAAEVKCVERMLRNFRPTAVLTDGVDYYLCVMMLLLAKRLGIPTAATWHAPFVQDVTLALLGCDSRLPAGADWFLSWSNVNDRWLQNIGASVKSVRTGNPVSRRSGRFVGAKHEGRLRVLLLQYAGTGEDYVFPQALQFEFFVQAVQMLLAIGAEVRLKLHPGPYNVVYYQKIAERYGLDVVIFKDEPFGDLVGWSDIVIGPAASGAMLEVAGTGKPYFPILLQPSLVNRDYFRNLPLYDGVAKLKSALDSHRYPDTDLIESEFSGNIAADGSPAHRMWDVMMQICRDESLSLGAVQKI